MTVLVEGPSDEEFFPAVLARSLDDLTIRHVPPQVYVAVEVEQVHNGGEERARWIAAVVRRRFADSTCVGLHVDASADPRRELRKYGDPVHELFSSSSDLPALVPLVPVKEMEAWALADLDVLRSVVGHDWDADRIDEADLLTQPERLSDPEKALDQITAAGVRPRKRARRAAEYLPLLAERIPLASLRRLDSFRAFEKDVLTVLDDLGWRRG